MKALTKIVLILLAITTFTNSSQAQAAKLFTNLYGSENGQSFSLPDTREGILSLHKITKISIKHSSRRIEKIQIAWVNQDRSTHTQSTGEDGGVWSHIYLTADEYIAGVEGRSGTLVDQLTFHTNKGRTFGPYGGNGGNAFSFELPKDARLVGFYGRSGQAIDQIGLIYATEDVDFGKKEKRTTRDHRTKENTTTRDHRTKNNTNTRDHRTKGNTTTRDHRTKNDASTRDHRTKENTTTRDHRTKNNASTRDHRTKENTTTRDHRTKNNANTRDHRTKENSSTRDHRANRT